MAKTKKKKAGPVRKLVKKIQKNRAARLEKRAGRLKKRAARVRARAAK